MQPGGSGQPFEVLTSHEREELAALYRLGYPRGDEFMIAKPMGQIWLWSSIAEMLIEEDGDYFRNFWTKPGNVGFDEKLHVEKDLIDRNMPVPRISTARDLQGVEFAGKDYSDARARALFSASNTCHRHTPLAFAPTEIGPGYRSGGGFLGKAV